jgi:hypothetical protein
MFAVAGRMNPNWALASGQRFQNGDLIDPFKPPSCTQQCMRGGLIDPFCYARCAKIAAKPKPKPLSGVTRFSVGHGSCCGSCASGGPCEGERHANPPKGQSCCESCAMGMPCEGGCGAACTCGKEGPLANQRRPNGFGLMHAQQTMGARRFHNPRWGLASR